MGPLAAVTVATAAAGTVATNSANSGGGSGWMAAAFAALCYGSYGVPIKATLNVDVHPFVLQTYKTIVLFLTCWYGVLLDHSSHHHDGSASEESEHSSSFKFTSWGLLSGFLWVIGGTGGIYGIRNAGMATAVGTWASTMVLVNFVWGILIFQEPMHSFPATVTAFFLLTVGLIGMSKYSSPSLKLSSSPSSTTTSLSLAPLLTTPSDDPNDDKNYEEPEHKTELEFVERTQELAPFLRTTTKNNNNNEDHDNNNNDNNEPSTSSLTDKLECEHRRKQRGINHVVLFSGRLVLTKRQLGIACSVFNGLFAGSSLIPLHYAKAQGLGGSAYIPSFGIGSLVSNSLIWILYLAYQYWCILRVRRHRHSLPPQDDDDDYAGEEAEDEVGAADLGVRGGARGPSSLGGVVILSPSILRQALASLPPFHFKLLWFRGFIAGLLLSGGMFGSILATTHLGQGVGNSLVQTKILISGLWGIFWYKEITDRQAIIRWFLSAALSVASILWLSYQRLAATSVAAATAAEGHGDGGGSTH